LNRAISAHPCVVPRDRRLCILSGEEQFSMRQYRDVVNVGEPAGKDDFPSARFTCRFAGKRRSTRARNFRRDRSCLPTAIWRICTTAVAPHSFSADERHFRGAIFLPASRHPPSWQRTSAQCDARGQIVNAWRIPYGHEPKEADILLGARVSFRAAEAVRSYLHQISAPKDAPCRPDPHFEALASLWLASAYKLEPFPLYIE